MVDFLIIARCGRALALSAKRAGYKVSVIDCFSDEDTKSVSESVFQIQYHESGFDIDELVEHVNTILSNSPNLKIILGTGFESNFQVLDCLCKLAPVLGNSKESISAVKDPKSFFEILKKYSISHPEFLFTRPADSKKFLIKKISGMGGDHINWCERINFEPDLNYYYQEYVSGLVSSVVFLANGVEAKIIGFNQQLQCNDFEDMPFLYQGAISLGSIDIKHRDVIQNIINNIMLEVELKGLCGLDYIINNEGDVVVLELNPRPPATFELYDKTQSLFNDHLACFDGKLPETSFELEKQLYNGYAILYAKENNVIGDKVEWPDWAKDRPESGSSIKEKYPVCTVHASDNSLDNVKTMLFNRLQEIEMKITATQNAA
jgi:uncharacterized protein